MDAISAATCEAVVDSAKSLKRLLEKVRLRRRDFAQSSLSLICHLTSEDIKHHFTQSSRDFVKSSRYFAQSSRDFAHSSDFVRSSRDFAQSSRQESSGAPQNELVQEETNFAQYKLNKVTQIYIISLVHTIFVLSDLLRHSVKSNNFDGCDYPM